MAVDDARTHTHHVVLVIHVKLFIIHIFGLLLLLVCEGITALVSITHHNNKSGGGGAASAVCSSHPPMCCHLIVVIQIHRDGSEHIFLHCLFLCFLVPAMSCSFCCIVRHRCD